MKEINQRKIQKCRGSNSGSGSLQVQILGKYMKLSLYAYPTLSPKYSLFPATGNTTLSEKVSCTDTVLMDAKVTVTS